MQNAIMKAGRKIGDFLPAMPVYVYDGKVYTFRSTTQTNSEDYFDFCKALRNKAERLSGFRPTDDFHLGH